MESHLLQMRGLKLDTRVVIYRNLASHLLQMRGLKPFSTSNVVIILSRIFYRCVD